MSFVAALGLAVMGSIVTADAYGSDVSQRARLVYALDDSAVPDCPDAAALRKAVAARLGFDPFWDWAPRTIVVQVRRQRGNYVAHVANVDPEGRSSTREIPPDDDCRQVIATAALAISIALDVTPARAPPPAAEPEPPAPPPAPVSAAPASPPSLAPPPASAGLAVGGGVSLFTGIAPRPGIAGFAFAELRRRTVSIGGELQVGAAVPANQLQVVLGAVGIVPCARFGPTFLCALGVIGWLHAWNVGNSSAGSDGSPFVALGGRGGVEVPLSAQGFVRLQGELLGEAYGPRFAVPEQSYQAAGLVYKMPPASIMSSTIGGALGLGVGAYFE